jgi:hypothetical protein
MSSATDTAIRAEEGKPSAPSESRNARHHAQLLASVADGPSVDIGSVRAMPPIHGGQTSMRMRSSSDASWRRLLPRPASRSVAPPWQRKRPEAEVRLSGFSDAGPFMSGESRSRGQKAA